VAKLVCDLSTVSSGFEREIILARKRASVVLDCVVIFSISSPFLLYTGCRVAVGNRCK
jgi:hypothetical protein